MKRVFQWIKYVLLTFIILTVTTILFLLNSTKTIQWAADQYAPQYGFAYKQISGGLLTGLEVEELTFKNERLLDSLKVGWNPASILYSKVSITHLEASGLNVENIKKVVKAFVPTESEEDNSSFILPFTIGVEEVKLAVDPFEWSGIGFKDISLDGKDIVYYGEGVDIDDLFLSVDTNVTSIQLSGGIQKKNIRIKKLSIVDIDTIAFKDVIKQMIAIKIHEEVVELVEPEVEDYKAGRKHLLPKTVQVDSAIVTVKPADHPQIRLHQGELNASSIKVDIYGIIDLKPDTVQVDALSVLLDTNLSRFSMQSKLQDEKITVESLSLRDIDTIALTKLFGSIENNQTAKVETPDINITASPLLPKLLYVKHMNTSSKSATYDLVFVKSTEMNATKVMLNIATLTAESGEINVAAVSSFVSLAQHGLIKDNHIESKGYITVHKALFETYGLPLKEDAFDTIPLNINVDEKQAVVEFDIEGEKILQAEEGEFNIEHLSLKNQIIYLISEGNLTLVNEGNVSIPYAKGLHLKNVLTLEDGVLDYRGKIDPGKFGGIDANYTKPLNDLKVTYQGDAKSIEAKIRSNLATIDADLLYDKELKVITKTVFPEDSLLRTFSPKLNLDALSPLEADLTMLEKAVHMNIRSKGLRSKVKFNTENKNLEGNMVLGGAEFIFEGNVEKELSLENNVSSLENFLKKISMIYAFEVPPLDGDVKMSLVLTEMKDVALNLNSNTLIYKADSKTEHIVNDTMISLGFTNSVLSLNKYHTTFQEQKIFATKPSVITFKEGNVEISPLWVNDELQVTGRYSMKEKKGEILAYADPLHISHEVTSLISRVNIKSSLNGNAASINGKITLLGGVIHYDMDTKTFDSDSDIVMVEELKKKEQSPLMDNMQVNVKINTLKALFYQTKDANIGVSADLLIKKERKGSLNIHGTVEILKDSTYTFKGKKFVFNKSTVTFKGDPKKSVLDMAVTYKTHRSEILIQITGSPASPHLVFSSIPYMKRQEILAMILFDTQEGVDDSSEEDMVKMMGDSMVNSVFSNAGGAVAKSFLADLGIKIDNIPFVGGSSDANKSKRALSSLFSKEETHVKPRHHIRFYGQRYFDEAALQKAMGIETKAFYQFWKKDDPKIKDTLLPTLEASLRNFYDSEGFYNAKFSIKQSKHDVIVNIRENEAVKIHSIDIQSDHDIADLVSFEKGRIFQAKEFVNVKKNIMNRLLKEGYCNYTLDTKAYVDSQREMVNIALKIKKGEVCTFGKVTVRGLKTIDDDIVLSRVRAKEGERFSTDKIKNSYEALYGLEAFDSVVLQYDVQKNNIVPLEVIGEEITKPWYLKAGAGWESATGIRLSAEVIRANLFGNAQSLGFGLVYSEIERVAEVEYIAPAKFKFLEYYLDLTARVGYSQFEYTGFVEDKVYAKVFLTYDAEQFNLNAGLAVENIEISLLAGPEASRYADPGSYQIVYPFFDFIYDKRDSKINPKNGYYLAGSVEYASPFKDDGSSYLKYDLEGRAILTLFNDLTLSAVGKMGTIDALENTIPASKLFYAGGISSNRAYGYKRVGSTLSSTSFSIVGGSSIANLSLEANYPLWGNIYGAVFTDSTMIGIESFAFGGDILSAAGIGLRYITPIGPLKIDWGMNVEDSSQNAIHFQIGQSF